MDESPNRDGSLPAAEADLCDPWRRRMRRSAERLRRLDERRFEIQIAKIEACLQRDSRWGLEDALTSCDRWRTLLQLAD